jgi:hypothetical protein
MRLSARVIAACVLAGSVFLGGCGDTVTDENFAKIHNDMTRQQVERILGDGTEETSGGYGVSAGGVLTGSNDDGRNKTYSWSSGNKQILIDFKDGKVVNARKVGF